MKIITGVSKYNHNINYNKYKYIRLFNMQKCKIVNLNYFEYYSYQDEKMLRITNIIL